MTRQVARAMRIKDLIEWARENIGPDKTPDQAREMLFNEIFFRARFAYGCGRFWIIAKSTRNGVVNAVMKQLEEEGLFQGPISVRGSP